MKKKIILSLVAVAALAFGVVGFNAFEAHVINVTAKIENALAVTPTEITFGTVFPQEQLNSPISIAMSESFIAEGRADDINYVIKEKPKCILKEQVPDGLPLYGLATEVDGRFVCVDAVNYTIMPSLCPYLSKTDTDPADTNDTSVPAFHGSLDWTVADSDNIANIAVGRLAKSQSDTSDSWNIDLKAPCFTDQCDQGWNAFVTGINPNAKPADYIQPIANEHKVFGCDLWIEATDISRITPTQPGVNYTTLSLENKHGTGYLITTDTTYGLLQFKPCGPTFDFNLSAQGLTANTSYSLIYYTDPWPGNHPGALIGTYTTDASGKISVIGGSKNIGTDIPNAADANYPGGGKIWLIPSSAYDTSTNSVVTWPYDQSWLFEVNQVKYSQAACGLPAPSLTAVGHDKGAKIITLTYSEPVHFETEWGNIPTAVSPTILNIFRADLGNVNGNYNLTTIAPGVVITSAAFDVTGKILTVHYTGSLVSGVPYVLDSWTATGGWDIKDADANTDVPGVNPWFFAI